ncbi:alcohol dehydrogenase [Pseudonocardia sp. N23]|uniref:alcohol dehydrogenase n=1 Tax=Pseudonocardia sp. N23 TaxID=1987376 RepID=UPI000C0330AC|nr:alcohol dehydrogenase [Pseudonocardia sp. N23]GAY11005.1 alcohol dehydrogenase [Pseudonocardia sp. N23]
MKAYALTASDGAIEAVERDIPSPPARGAVLRVTRVGVCHSDVHLRTGAYDLGERGELTLKDRGISLPLVMGHEIVGELVSLGDEAGEVTSDMAYCVYPWIGCGDCFYCGRGEDNFCSKPGTLGVFADGGYAEYVVVPDVKYLFGIGDLDPSWAATLGCSGITAYSAVKKAYDAQVDNPVVVIGAGGVGLAAISILKGLGCSEIIAVDISADKLEVASEYGATSTALSGEVSLSKLTNTDASRPPAAIIDFVNSSQTAATAFDSLGKGATLVQVGLHGGQLVMPNPLVASRALAILGSYVGTVVELAEVVDLAKRGEIPAIPTEEFPLSLESINRALDRLHEGSARGRQVLTSSTTTAK